MTASPTQTDVRSNTHGPVEIKARDLNFEAVKDLDMQRWHGGNAVVTQLYNGLSLLFPEGEEFFVDSVRMHAKEITDPTLKSHVRGFMTQESIHSREHEAYNEALDEQHLPTRPILKMNKQGLDWTRKYSAQFQLASTVAAEHLTAVLADMLLSDERMMKGAPEDMARVWRWHAVEETEHKAVAFDVYQACYGGTAKGYRVRASAMALTLLTFVPGILLNIWILLKGVEQKPTFREWLGGLKYLFVGPGFVTKMMVRSIPFFKPGFHPWDEKNFHHVIEWNEQNA